jgi:hypothetical protein
MLHIEGKGGRVIDPHSTACVYEVGVVVPPSSVSCSELRKRTTGR